MSAQTAAIGGRISLTLGVFALLGAWMTQLTGSSLFGMSQQHLFSDATVLSLLGIAMLIDAHLHKERV